MENAKSKNGIVEVDNNNIRPKDGSKAAVWRAVRESKKLDLLLNTALEFMNVINQDEDSSTGRMDKTEALSCLWQNGYILHRDGFETYVTKETEDGSILVRSRSSHGRVIFGPYQVSQIVVDDKLERDTGFLMYNEKTGMALRLNKSLPAETLVDFFETDYSTQCELRSD